MADAGSNAGGFSFDLCTRNSVLEKKGLQAPGFLKTGTTIAGVIFKASAGHGAGGGRWTRGPGRSLAAPLWRRCLAAGIQQTFRRSLPAAGWRGAGRRHALHGRLHGGGEAAWAGGTACQQREAPFLQALLHAGLPAHLCGSLRLELEAPSQPRLRRGWVATRACGAAAGEPCVCLYVQDKNCEKIHYIAPNIYCCGAGTAADTENVTGALRCRRLRCACWLAAQPGHAASLQ